VDFRGSFFSRRGELYESFSIPPASAVTGGKRGIETLAVKVCFELARAGPIDV